VIPELFFFAECDRAGECQGASADFERFVNLNSAIRVNDAQVQRFVLEYDAATHSLPAAMIAELQGLFAQAFVR